MPTNTRKMRSVLMTGASTALLATFGASAALAQSVTETAAVSISKDQAFNSYTTPTAGLVLNGNTQGSVNANVTNNDAAAYALQHSTVSVGSSATTGNASSATGYANTANLTVNGDLNNVTGSGLATVGASSDAATLASTVQGTTDIGIALTQQNTSTAATAANGTDMGITIDHGASNSTAKIVGNSQKATGVLNSGVNALNLGVNNTSGSGGVAAAQSSLNSSLTASVSSLDKFATGSGPSTNALLNSTVALSDNSQAATAVANSGSNTQSVTGNGVTLMDDANGQAKAGATYVAGDIEASPPTSATHNTSAVAGYATVSKQELAVSTVGAKTVTATIDDAAGSAGYLASVTGNVVGSTLSNDTNAATALARGNEVSNATTIAANSIATGSLASTNSGTVAAIASQQAVTVATGTQTIVAQVGGAGSDGPIVSNAITGDVKTSSRLSASDNAVLADAAANRGGSAITASATTIATLGTEVTSAGVSTGVATANAAFAVANKQSVASGTSVQAGLVDSFTTPTKSTYVNTAVSGSVTGSDVVSNGNSLAANAAGNATLGTGNAITLSGTNLETSAAIASDQLMAGNASAWIGMAGVAATSPTTHDFVFSGTSQNIGLNNYTFTGTASGTSADRDALDLADTNPNNVYTWDSQSGLITVVSSLQSTSITSLPGSYTSGGSAGTPAAGGVIVTVGNDITGSSVTVDGNETAGSAKGNSATNALAASATNLTRGNGASASAAGSANGTTGTANADMAVANVQANTGNLYSTVGAMFGVSATGVDNSGTLSDVGTSTVSVSDNAQSSTVTGNTGTNSIALSATNATTTSALANNQSSTGGLGATISDYSGANVTVGRDIASSTVVVDGNAISGATTGNAATNRVTVTGSSTLAASDATVGATATPTSTLATADHALANTQSVTGDETTTVVGKFDIVTLGAGAPAAANGTSDITASTLSVSGNAQSAATIGNTVANSMTLAGGSVATNGALQSVQSASGSGGFTATSTMTVAAPAANSTSNLTLDNNSNTASSTVNDAANSMVVKADTALTSTTVTGSAPNQTYGANASLSGTAGVYAASADYVVNNAQTVATNAVTATATTNVWNNDGGATGQSQFATNGINQSTVDLSGNSTTATGMANRSTNSLTLSANSDSASAGVVNQQANGGAVSATATTKADVLVAGYNDASADPSPVDTSSVTLNGNATTARAGGNTATNALSASATNFANTSAGGSASLTGGRLTDSVAASFAVLNEQGNTGVITAAANVTYGASFNNLGTAPSVTNSSVALNGNSAVAVAYGNAATNSLTLAALNSPASGTTPTTAAIASNQSNTGAINATTGVTSGALAINAVASGVGNTGGVTNSSLSVNGNSLGAAAYGNSATSTLTIGGNNVNVTGYSPL